MFVFGHVGLTLGAARKLDPKVELRWAALLSLAPDLVDKPLSRLIPDLVHHNTRSFGHSALFSLFVLAGLLLWKRRPKTALVLWACYIGHFLCDAMWSGDNPAVLFWPLLGEFPAPVHGTLMSPLTAWYLAGELAGAVILVRLASEKTRARRRS